MDLLRRRPSGEGCTVACVALGEANPAGHARAVHGVCPMDCPDTCSWVVTVEGGKATKLAGAEDHPFTRGVLCVKLNRYLEHTRADDRLLYPLRRVGRKGEGRFARIGWDEALSAIAERWRAVIDDHGPQAIWPYYGTGTMGMIQGVAGAGRRLWNALGTSRHEMTICAVAGFGGTDYVLGEGKVGMDPETLGAARLILLWGTNPMFTGHHVWKHVLAARHRGAHVVAIDPIRTRSAANADEHLAPIPGTDAALALGLLHVVVANDAQDDEYLRDHTVGWDAFRQRIAEFPPARVAAITGLPEERIVGLGERLARTRPTAIRMSMGLQRHAGGGMAVRTITAIPGITGDWRYPGGGAVYHTGGFFRGNWAALWRDDLRPPGTRSLVMTQLATNLRELDDPPIKALLLYNSNPLASNPDQNAVRRELAREDLFTVAIEHFPTDTVDYADIVLPATMQTEHADLHNAYGHLYLAWNEPAVEAPGECLPNSEIFRRLARALGLTEPCLYDDDETLARQVLDSEHLSLEGVTLDRLRAEGWVRLGYPVPFVPFAEGGFATPSGKLELFSERARADGHDPMPGYTPPLENTEAGTADAERYPLVLLATASQFLLNSTFANKPRLAAKLGEATLVVHPDDASARDLASGQYARVENRRGSFEVRVEVDDRVRPGVVATTKGRWPRTMRGASNANATVEERNADMGGGAVFHDNRVEVVGLGTAAA
ncbi:MAG TPA: molybdopterin-dependent oxidoreductase [Solirubrobacteraceae bacterium]